MGHFEDAAPYLIVLSLIGMVSLLLLPPLDTKAETVTHNLEGGIDITITHPDRIIAGRAETVSILVQNNGWEDKQEISFVISHSDARVITSEPSELATIGNLSEGGSYGESITLHIANNAGSGVYFVNMRYTHILVANNETPQDPYFYDIAIPIKIKQDVSVTIRTETPESIFANAEFPISVEVISEDVDITNVRVSVIPPRDIEFRGETLHTFSKIQKGVTVGITSRIITPVQEVNTEYKLPFEIIIQYVDDTGDEKTDAQTVSLTLRPRTFMELTTDGGIWIGNFFIAPYVSIGTIIGVPAGTILSLLIRRRGMSKKSKE